MKKIIYLLLIVTNALLFNSFNAQAQWCSNANYVVDTIPYNPQPYGVGTTVPFLQDTFSTVIPIGFNFNFYQNNYSSVLISSHGYITFNTSLALQPDTNYLIQIPQPSGPLNSVFLFYSFYGPGPSTTIRYSTTGIAPNRKFIVTFDSLLVSDGFTPDSCSGQLVLNETDNSIEMFIKNYNGYMNILFGAEQGVQNATGTVASASPGRNFGPNTWDAYMDGRLFTYANLPYSAPSICIVGVDSATNKNLVIWDKPAGLPIDSFIIYRETVVAGVYDRIGSQAYSSFSTFIDTGSNPAQQANRYKIGFRDSCGIVSDTSDNHKTVHLSINQGGGGSWNLIWDAYEGFSFSTFNIYRGTSVANMTLLTSIASTLYSYTDLTPPVGTVYYVIEVVNPNGCNPSIITSYSSSRSNIFSTAHVGIETLDAAAGFNISPNPATNQFTITSEFAIKEITIYNTLGESVFREYLNTKYKTLNTNFPAGIYFVKVSDDEKSFVRKLVVE